MQIPILVNNTAQCNVSPSNPDANSPTITPGNAITISITTVEKISISDRIEFEKSSASYRPEPYNSFIYIGTKHVIRPVPTNWNIVPGIVWEMI